MSAIVKEEKESYSEDLATLQKGFRGNVLTPTSDGYTDACKMWITLHDNRPAVILQVRGISDVMKAVAFGKKHFDGGRTSVKSGGHGYSGASANVGGLTIDMCLNKEVIIDIASKSAYIGAGCLLGDIDKELNAHGYCTPVGAVSATGYAGLAVGGGVGHLTKAFGLAIDNWIEVDIVTADGKLTRCSEQNEPDLFWALRGAGHHMGVVVGFRVKIYECPFMAEVAMVTFNVEDLGKVLPVVDNMAITSEHKRLCFFTVIGKIPPSESVAQLVGVWYSGPEKGVVKDVVAQIEAESSAKATTKHIMDIPYVAMQSMLDDGFAQPDAFYGISRWVSKPIGKEFVEKLQKVLAEAPPTGMVVAFWYGGGKMNEVAPDATAFRNRDARGFIEMMTRCRAPVTVEQARSWARKACNETLVDHVDSSGYSNTKMSPDDDKTPDSDRLVGIKQKYDPDNYFRKQKQTPAAAK